MLGGGEEASARSRAFAHPPTRQERTGTRATSSYLLEGVGELRHVPLHVFAVGDDARLAPLHWKREDLCTTRRAAPGSRTRMGPRSRVRQDERSFSARTSVTMIVRGDPGSRCPIINPMISIGIGLSGRARPASTPDWACRSCTAKVRRRRARRVDARGTAPTSASPPPGCPRTIFIAADAESITLLKNIGLRTPPTQSTDTSTTRIGDPRVWEAAAARRRHCAPRSNPLFLPQCARAVSFVPERASIAGPTRGPRPRPRGARNRRPLRARAAINNDRRRTRRARACASRRPRSPPR